MSAYSFTEKAFTTAQELIATLTEPSYDNIGSRWLFRGVARASDLLLPSSHRDDDPQPFRNVPSNATEQIVEEFAAIRRFYEAAYFEGLRIPNWDSMKASMDRFGLIREAPAGVWPLSEMLELIALAQHHGTPTRLLDWTLDPFVAAYFAALKPRKDDSHMALWVLDTDALIDTFQGKTPIRSALAIVRIPYDLNQNARAQRGVFTDYHPQRQASTDAILRLPLSDYLASKNAPIGALTKMTLPRGEAPDLLRELHRKRISGASMFPGFDGVARAERERMSWD